MWTLVKLPSNIGWLYFLLMWVLQLLCLTAHLSLFIAFLKGLS